MTRARLLAGVIALVPGVASLAAAESPRRPNVIVILADDMGFSDLGCYGGEIRTPNIDRLAAEGVRFTQFYNMARCCPTRAALLTGLYPHQAGVGFMNDDQGPESYRGELNDRCATIAEVLRERAGYRTGMVGKWHLSHLTISQPGPRAKRLINFEEEAAISPSKKSWPFNRGFEEHVGTIPGVENFYDPYGLVHNEEPIKPGEDFYYTDFITEQAVRMINGYAEGDKPFFLYVAHVAPHWPMQAREEDVAPYAETYKVGWDEIRRRRLARQKELGIVKSDVSLSPRPDEYKRLNEGASVLCPWEEAPEKEWQARRMAVYAGMVTRMDAGVGRIMETLKERGLERDTVVMFMSDNGACAENVRPNWYDVPSKTRSGRPVTVGNDPNFVPGPEEVYQSYGPAWANASNTPFRRFKHWAEEGGISSPLVVRWPGRVKGEGGVNHEAVGHVIDLMPTVLEMAGVAYPKERNGRALVPVEGRSLVPVLRGEGMERGPLFWEHEGNRAVRVGEWKLVAAHGQPWELYNVVADRTEMRNLAGEMGGKVEELRKEYEAWARRAGVEEWPVRR